MASTTLGIILYMTPQSLLIKLVTIIMNMKTMNMMLMLVVGSSLEAESSSKSFPSAPYLSANYLPNQLFSSELYITAARLVD